MKLYSPALSKKEGIKAGEAEVIASCTPRQYCCEVATQAAKSLNKQAYSLSISKIMHYLFEQSFELNLTPSFTAH